MFLPLPVLIQNTNMSCLPTSYIKAMHFLAGDIVTVTSHSLAALVVI